MAFENNDGTINIVGKGKDFVAFGSDGVGSINREDSKTRLRKGFQYDKTVVVCNFKLAFGGKRKLFREHKQELIAKTNPGQLLRIEQLITILKTLKTGDKSFSYVIGGFEGNTPRIASLKWNGKIFIPSQDPGLKFVTGGCGSMRANRVMGGYKGDTMTNLLQKMEEAYVFTCIFSPSCGGMIRFTYFMAPETEKMEKTKMIEELYDTHVESLIQQKLPSVDKFDSLSTEEKHSWFTKKVVAYTWVQAGETLDEEESQDLSRIRFDF